MIFWYSLSLHSLTPTRHVGGSAAEGALATPSDGTPRGRSTAFHRLVATSRSLNTSSVRTHSLTFLSTSAVHTFSHSIVSREKSLLKLGPILIIFIIFIIFIIRVFHCHSCWLYNLNVIQFSFKNARVYSYEFVHLGF